MRALVLLLASFTTNAAIIYGPNGGMVINPMEGGGYTVSSLNGGGVSAVTPVPNGLVIISPDQPATFIQYDYEEQPKAMPVIPVSPNTDVMPEYRF